MTAPLLLLRRAVNGGRLTPKEGARAHAFLDGLQSRQETPGATHWPECWREHHGCAVALLERLEGPHGSIVCGGSPPCS